MPIVPIIGKRISVFAFLIILCAGSHVHGATWLSESYFLDIEIEKITPFSEAELGEKIKLAEQEGQAETQYILARMYDDGIVIKQDKIKAEKLLTAAAVSGHKKAQLALANFYNFKGDLTKSRKWFTELANNGNPIANFQIGMFYELGRGVFINPDKAMEYYLLSSQKNYLKADLRLALIYQHDEKKKNLAKAIHYYKKAASNADKENALRISILLAKLYASIAKDQGSESDIFKWTLKAAELGDIDSQYLTGSRYQNGTGAPVDYEQARNWYTKAADQGDIKSMTALGYIHANGIGVPVNIEEGLRWYKYAAERGSDEAAWNLGNMYLSGSGVAKDEKEAQIWFKRAEILRNNKEIELRKKAANE